MNVTSDNTLQGEINSLSNELNPEHDLWPGIEHSLQARKNMNILPTWGIAAAVAIFSVLMTWVVLSPIAQQGNPELHALLSELKNEHNTTKNMLIDSYKDRLPYYANWDDQLQQLETAETAIFSALSEEPLNLELVGLLRQVQHKQLNLIESVYSPRISSL